MNRQLEELGHSCWAACGRAPIQRSKGLSLTLGSCCRISGTRSSATPRSDTCLAAPIVLSSQRAERRRMLGPTSCVIASASMSARSATSSACPRGPWSTTASTSFYVAARPAYVTSSVMTLKPASVQGPKEVTIATSVASRPRAIKMRPTRGVLWRASNVYQRPR